MKRMDRREVEDSDVHKLKLCAAPELQIDEKRANARKLEVYAVQPRNMIKATAR